MIFVDSNVPMYLVGAPHPNRDRTADFLAKSASESFVTNAEVYQELIHRYASIDRRDAIVETFRLLDDLVDTVFPITRADAGAAADIAAAPGLSARDCLHLAVMRANGVSRALTFDRGFARQPDITVLP